MFSANWQTSPWEFGVIIDRHVRIPVDGGITLDSDIFRLAGEGRFPAILAMSPYPKEEQSMEISPVAFSGERASLEAGDFNFYVRRGYVFVIANIRGTQGSGGYFAHLDPDSQTIKDICGVIAWLADQPWCDGNVGMCGISYFAILQNKGRGPEAPTLEGHIRSLRLERRLP